MSDTRPTTCLLGRNGAHPGGVALERRTAILVVDGNPDGLRAGRAPDIPCRDTPTAPLRDPEAHLDGAILQPTSPHERGRNAQVCVGWIDPAVGAVRPVSEQRVRDDDVPVVVPHIPSAGIRPRDRQRTDGSVARTA